MGSAISTAEGWAAKLDGVVPRVNALLHSGQSSRQASQRNLKLDDIRLNARAPYLVDVSNTKHQTVSSESEATRLKNSSELFDRGQQRRIALDES